MVDLFKKKGNATPKPTKQKPAKKPLFGSKKPVAASDGTEGIVVTPTKPAKKSGFAGLFGKKPQKAPRAAKGAVAGIGTEEVVAAKPAAKKPLFGATKSEKAKPTKAGTKSAKAPMNVQKLIILVGVLFLVVIAGLAAKIFLFSEPEPAPEPQPIATTSIPPAPAPEPEQAPVEATPAAEVVVEPQPEEVIIQQPSQPTEEVAVAELPTESATPNTAAPNTQPTSTAPAPAEKITYEEFVEQSKNRVYRERSTEGQ